MILTGMTAPTEAIRPTDSLANRLWLLRIELGRREGRPGPISQREMAMRCGIGIGSLQSWEEGRAPRDAVRQLSKVARATGVDLNWLLFGGELATEPEEGPGGGGLSTRTPVSVDADTDDPVDVAEFRRRVPLRRRPRALTPVKWAA